MYPMIRSTKMSNASVQFGSDEEEILPKSVVPVRAFQPDFLFKISSACGGAWISLGTARVSTRDITHGADVHLFGATGTRFASIMCEVENQT